MVHDLPSGGSSPTARASTATMLAGLNPLLAPLVGVASGAIELVMEKAAIDEINGKLELARTALHEAEGQMQSIAASGVGGSWWGSQLSHHSELANDRLLDTLTEMKTGLDNFATALELAMKHVSDADEQIEVVAKQGAACIPGDLGDAPTCGPVA